MAAAVDRTLAAASPTAERALYGTTDWTCYQTTASGAVTASHAASSAVTTPAGGGFQHFIDCLVATADADSAAVQVVQIKDGPTVIFEASLPTTFRQLVLPFPRALRASKNTAVSAVATGTGNAANMTLWMSGWTVGAP